MALAAARLVSGQIDEAGLTSLFAEQAKGFYQWAAPQIDRTWSAIWLDRHWGAQKGRK